MTGKVALLYRKHHLARHYAAQQKQHMEFNRADAVRDTAGIYR